MSFDFADDCSDWHGNRTQHFFMPIVTYYKRRTSDGCLQQIRNSWDVFRCLRWAPSFDNPLGWTQHEVGDQKYYTHADIKGESFHYPIPTSGNPHPKYHEQPLTLALGPVFKAFQATPYVEGQKFEYPKSIPPKKVHQNP